MQTANFVAGFSRLEIISIEVTLYSHLLLADTVSFEPVDFSHANRTIIEAIMLQNDAEPRALASGCDPSQMRCICTDAIVNVQLKA